MTPDQLAVEAYLARMLEIRGTGGATKETSYYSAFENLMNEVGRGLNPHVICNGQLRNQGAGHPDFGLYVRSQCSGGAPKSGQGEVPERGVVEVKSLGDDSWQTSKGAQATKYFDHYRLVLITNYREFRLIGEDEHGKPIEREFYRLADDEDGFWMLAASARKTSLAHGSHFAEFLRRVMINAAPLRRPKDIARLLASYARDALATLEQQDATALASLRASLEVALGIRFDGEKGEHFFRSTLIQTLFYGIFSAWVSWAKSSAATRFDWRLAAYAITVPMIRALFEEVAKPSRLAPLGLIGTLDRTGEAMNRIDPVVFFQHFDAGEAVQHFYEPFLQAYDPELRKQMGVWYTPKEIVRYMVERVDRALRTELGIEDGLADKNVYVLDPCCGTGAYVIEVLRRIEDTLRAKGDDPLIGEDVKQAARERVFGFEIMSAPFVIAHWQVGEMLARLKAPIDAAKGERPAIYLTNALTGWEPPVGPKATLALFPEMAEERDQAEHVKRDVPVIVVIGNPPYNAYSGTSPDEEAGLVDPYKDGLISKWGIKKFNLDDLYVRFFRIAERRIGATGRGIVSYISNYSWTREPSYVVMRQHLLASFDKFWIENMHGDRNKTEYAPDGTTSETVFAMRGFSPGIRQGITIGLAVQTGKPGKAKVVRYRDDIDAGRAEVRRQQLLDSLTVTPFDDQYELADPQPWNKLSFRPRDVGANYLAWPTLPDLGALEPINGLMEKRGGALIDVDADVLSARMKNYLDAKVSWQSLEALGGPLVKDAARFDAAKARIKQLAASAFDADRIVRYAVRPFDVRHAYYTDTRPLWNEPRPQLWTQTQPGNLFLVSRKAGVADPEGPPAFFTRALGDNDALRGHAYYMPFRRHTPAEGMLGASTDANLSAAARAWLKTIGIDADPNLDHLAADLPWLHALATVYSPQYIGDNAHGLSIDWPRVPLPANRQALERSAELGRKVAALLDSDLGVPGVTNGAVAGHLKVLGNISSTDLRLTAGWGSRDSKNRINPGQGRTEQRDWTEDEREALRAGFDALGIADADGFAMLGRAVDVYLNGTAFWRGVPETTWDYVIGGYPVIKKWLSYRDEAVLGRPLTKEEAREVSAMVRRITALVLLSGELDASYETCRDDAYAWPKT